MAGDPRPVLCSSCSMWELRDAADVPDSYTCRKYVQLQLLLDRMMALELRMDSLWSIRDAEEVLDSTFSKLVTLQIRIAEGERRMGDQKAEKKQEGSAGIPCSHLRPRQ
eukprot:g15211.t1